MDIYTQRRPRAAKKNNTMVCIFDNMFDRRAAHAFDFTWRNRAAMIQCIGTWNPAFGWLHVCLLGWRVAQTFFSLWKVAALIGLNPYAAIFSP